MFTTVTVHVHRSRHVNTNNCYNIAIYTHTQMAKKCKWCKDCHLHGHVPPVPKDQDPWALHRHSEPVHWHLFSWSRARNSQETLTVPLVWCWHPKSNLDHPRSALSMGLDVTALFATPAEARSLFYSYICTLKQWE